MRHKLYTFMYHSAESTRTEGGPQSAEKEGLCVAAVFLFGPFSRSYHTRYRMMKIVDSAIKWCHAETQIHSGKIKEEGFKMSREFKQNVHSYVVGPCTWLLWYDLEKRWHSGYHWSVRDLLWRNLSRLSLELFYSKEYPKMRQWQVPQVHRFR